MRRYIFNSRLYSQSPEKAPCFDVAVIGGGMAGLFAALELSQSLSVALIYKGDEKSGSSWLAQGGICCVLDKDDTFEDHITDTLNAGAGHCNREAVEIMVKEGPENIRRMVEYGVPFDMEPDGSFHLTREGGHHKNRILHCGGDATGREITKALGKCATERSNITLFRDHSLVDIITDDSGVCGIAVNDGTKDIIIKCPQVIVATGGAGQLYSRSTTPEGNTGEGIAACLRAGCKLCDMEFVQFHPTAFAIHNEGERVFLISEAVRGEGAILKNKHGEAFMSRKGQHVLADLAPRDVVTRAVLDEMKKTDDTKVYLDASCMTKEFFHSRFPTITAKCLEHGINPPQDLIPVHPTQHYLMGGVKTDVNGATDIKGLFVCGEAACTGVHGANRLASNSTLECVVFAKRAAKYINENPIKPTGKFKMPDVKYRTVCPGETELLQDMQLIKQTMTQKVGAERKLSELNEAHGVLLELMRKYADCDLEDRCGYALFSAIQTAAVIVESACARKESLGSHHITL